MGGGGSKALDAHAKTLCKQAVSGSKSWKDKETKMLETFKAWDKDNSGHITKEELQEVFTRLGCKISASELGKVLKDADVDKDSKISYEEFVAWLCRAPHLEHYFKLSEDILKRNMKEAAAIQQTLQKEMEKSGNPMATMMKMGQKLDAVQKKGQDRINKELTPVIKKTFAYHDKDGNGVLTYDESIILFSNYAERLEPFMQAASELSCMQMMKMTDMKADLSSIQKEFMDNFSGLKKDYDANREERHKAAFAVLDVSKDSKLQESEVIAAFLHGHPKNAEFMTALGLFVDPQKMGKVEVAMEPSDCDIQ